jgi:peroxiredoxin
MVTNLCLLTCALTAGQSVPQADWLLAPQLVRGQELVYRGTFSERPLVPHVLFERSYRLETNFFVMDDLPGRRWQVAILTLLTPKSDRQGEAAAQPSSVRLEVLETNRQGRLACGKGTVPAVPLDGPPTLECGFLVEAPAVRVGPGDSWPVEEPGRPPRTWRIVGTEVVRSTACIKLVGEQQSPDWDHPRADSHAWWRRDTLWLAPQAGIAYRVERQIKQRDPARSQPTYESVLRYELDHRLTYPGQLYDDYRDVIEQAQRLQNEAAPLLADPVLYRTRLEALLRKVNFCLEERPRPMPYRLALLQVRHRVEAASRGEIVPAPEVEESPSTVSASAAVAPGRRAPDFLVTDLVGKRTLRLYQYRGRPLLLVFFNPATELGRRVLDFARDLNTQEKGITVLGLAMSGDEKLVRRQHADLHLSFPVADGRGLHVLFDINVTPKLVLLDAEGVVQASYTGWSSQTAVEVREALGRLRK